MAGIRGPIARRILGGPAVALHITGDYGDILHGELENISRGPLTNLVVTANFAVPVVRSGFVVGERVEERPPHFVEYPTGETRKLPDVGGGAMLYPAQAMGKTLPPGARAFIGLGGANQHNLRTIRVFRHDPNGDWRSEEEIPCSVDVEPR